MNPPPSTFPVVIPDAASGHYPARGLWYAQATVATGGGMARILIVDHEPLITAMLEDWLSELGDIVVGPADSLASALELADSDIDAAIVDVSLGKDNSYPVSRR
jgi:hypothetical protein